MFSFFEPTFTRAGTVLEREGLVAPESNIVGYAETFRLLRILERAEFFTHNPLYVIKVLDEAREGNLASLADKLNLLLTGGRVPSTDVQYITERQMQQHAERHETFVVPFLDAQKIILVQDLLRRVRGIGDGCSV